MKRFTSLLVCLLFIGLQAMMAQDMQVRGALTDDGGSPLPGVSIVVKGTTIGTATDADGMYELTIPSGATLVFSSVGMKSQEIAVGNQTTIDVVLEADVLGLEEVVVTALGITREKKALGYAVQEVKGDELARAQESNVVNSLQGKLAGVQITNASGGGISSSSRIIIRGTSSFGNNQPLFVVDGTPIVNASTGVDQWEAEDFGNQAMDIDPNHVESISVLKGPSATALYGSRGANGVVLITTKKASAAGKGIGVSFDHSTTFDKGYIWPTYQNSYGQGYNGSEYKYNASGSALSYNDYAAAESFSYLDGAWSGVQDGIDESWGPRLDAGLMIPQFTGNWNGSSYDPSPWVSHPDNVKDFFETGHNINNSLALSAASARSSARLTLSNNLQTGIIPNTDQTRNNIGISASTNLGSRLKAYVNANYVNTLNDNIPGGGYSGINVMQSIGSWFGRQVDMEALKNNWETKNPQGNNYNWNRSYHDNPYWTTNKKIMGRQRNRIYGNVNLDYKITDWLSVLGRVGTDYSHEVRKRKYFDGTVDVPAGGNFWQQTRTYNENNADLIFSAAGNVTSDIRLGGSLGGNYRRDTYQWTELSAAELTVPDLFTISNVKGNPSTGMYDREKVTNSVFGTFNFAFKEYLFLDATFRNDWSSTLPKDNWSYFYPSVSLGWIFTETFGMPQNILSFGKVRASWAQVGNDTGPYQIIPTYSGDSPFGNVTPFSFTNELPPLNLLPEQTSSFEVGGDFRFFMNRLGLDITYYNAVTENQIMAVDISTATGFGSMRLNAGEIQNTGLELMLTGKIIQSGSGFNWDIMFNYAKNRNVVNKLYTDPETGQELESLQINSSWGGVTIQAIPGETYGVIKGGAFIKDANGRIEVRSDGTPARSSTPEEIGNTTPDFIGGVNNIFSYKGLTANILIDFRKGGDLFSVTHWFGAYAGITASTVDGDPYIKPAVAGQDIRVGGLIVDGVMADGSENTTVTSAQDYFESYWGLAEPSIIDGGFIKLRELVIGYDIPMGNVSFIEALNISFIGRNLGLLWTHKSNDIHIDPETGFGTSNDGVGLEHYQLPAVRSLGFKIGVKF
jgi:TonB-linked SusC/RagA family outer membrane protein